MRFIFAFVICFFVAWTSSVVATVGYWISGTEEFVWLALGSSLLAFVCLASATAVKLARN